MTTPVHDATSESALFDGYSVDPAVLALQSAGRVKRPCACRGVVSADPADPTDGVMEHNDSIVHLVWRAERLDQ